MKAQLIRYLLGLLGALPLPLRAFLGRMAGRLFFLFPTTDRRIAGLQMDLFIPELGGKKHLAAVYAGLGQTILETINLKPFLRRLDRYLECPDPELIERLRSQERPILTLTAHLANWDLLAAWTVASGFNLVAVGREAQYPSFQEALTAIREAYGVRTIWRGDRSGLRELVAYFRKPGVIAALIDQDTSVVSQSIPFFGAPARTPSSLVELALKFNATIVTAFIIRKGFQHYLMQVQEVDNSLGTSGILEVFNRRLEDLVRAYPEQWVWVHKRWRSLGPDQRLSSKLYLAYLEKRISELKKG